MLATPLYAGILALLYLVLSSRIIVLRRQGVSLGDGGNPVLLRRIRAHGNFSEYVPFILILLGILELSHLPTIILHILGITLVVARLLHGYAFSFRESFKFGRVWGAGLTFLLLLVCGLLCIYQAISAHMMLPLNI